MKTADWYVINTLKQLRGKLTYTKDIIILNFKWVFVINTCLN